MEEDELAMDMFETMGIEDLELNQDDTPEEIKALLEQEEIETPEGTEGTEGGEEAGEEGTPPEGVGSEEGEEKGNGQDDSPNNFSSFAAVLNEQGLLPTLNLEETKINSAEDLVNAVKSESERQAKEYIVSKIGEQGYEALEKGITLQEYQAHTENTNSLESIDDSVIEKDLELSKNIILQDYINQGISEDRALRILKKTIDLGEDAIIEEAKESLVSLKLTQEKELVKLQAEREKQKAAAEAKQEAIDNDLKNSIYSSKEIIKGIKVDKATQEQVYKSITQVVGEGPNGVMENKLMRDRREDPINFDTKLYYLYEMTNGFKDFSKLVSKSQTKAMNLLEDSLRQTSFQAQGDQPAFMTDPDSYTGSNLGSELVL